MMYFRVVRRCSHWHRAQVHRFSKATANLVAQPHRKRTFHQRLKQHRFAKLVKLDLSALVVVTTAGGYLISGGSMFAWTTFGGVMLGTSLCASSASTFNQIKEVHYDKLMHRTRNRPLPTKRVSLEDAQRFGYTAAAAGLGTLLLTTNVSTALLGGGTILLYTHVYTPLKRVTRFNTEIGALVGAVPPVMGWTAATAYASTSGLSVVATPEALFLAATLFSWQMHHFMAIAWRQRRDYERAGFIMQSSGDTDGDKTLHKGVFWAASMGVLPFVSTYLDLTTQMFILTGTVANSHLWYRYWRFYQERTSASAHQAMIAGFPQLALLMFLGVLHLKNREHYTCFQELKIFREKGEKFCIWLNHELLKKNKVGADRCPVHHVQTVQAPNDVLGVISVQNKESP